MSPLSQRVVAPGTLDIYLSSKRTQVAFVLFRCSHVRSWFCSRFFFLLIACMHYLNTIRVPCVWVEEKKMPQEIKLTKAIALQSRLLWQPPSSPCHELASFYYQHPFLSQQALPLLSASVCVKTTLFVFLRPTKVVNTCAGAGWCFVARGRLLGCSWYRCPSAAICEHRSDHLPVFFPFFFGWSGRSRFFARSKQPWLHNLTCLWLCLPMLAAVSLLLAELCCTCKCVGVGKIPPRKCNTYCLYTREFQHVKNVLGINLKQLWY